MKTVYVASPYSEGNKLQNTLDSITIGVLLISQGFLPFLPLLSHFWNEYSPHDYEYWMEMDEEWVIKCDIFLRLPGISSGADREEKIAIEHNKPIYHNIYRLFLRE